MTRVALAAALLISLGARAEQESARSHYAQGQAEYNLGHYAEALKEFEAAYKMRPVPALLFNIGQCHRFIGDFQSAVTTYRAFVRTADPNDKNLALARDLLKQSEAALAKQTAAQKAQPFGLVKPPPGGEETHPAPAPQMQPQPEPQQQVAVAPPPPVTKPAPIESTHTVLPAPPPEPERPRTWTWVAAGATGVAIAGGAFFELRARSTASDLSSAPHEQAELDQLQPRVGSDVSKARLLFGVATAAAIAAGALFVMHY
jgi:tetratricopeptide (TPR) repeat protein